MARRVAQPKNKENPLLWSFRKRSVRIKPMTHVPPPLKRVIDVLSELPSIGPRQATRLAFYLVNQGKNTIDALASGIGALANIKTCSECFFIHQTPNPICGICSDPARNHAIIAIIEK